MLIGLICKGRRLASSQPPIQPMRTVASAFALLLCSAAPALSASWQDFRDYGVGEGRATTLKRCERGRQMNARGLSEFDPRKLALIRADLLKSGRSPAEVDAVEKGYGAAMKIVCPEVW